MENNTKTNIQGQNIIITGSTTGIGRAAALALAKMGANILVAGSSKEHLEQTLSDLSGQNTASKIEGIIVDLATQQGVEQLFTRADEAFGHLDVLINNAALAHQDVTDGNYPDWERVVKTNLLGYIACARYALDRMDGRGQGHIVNIGSMSADVREKGSSVYVATKAGIQGFSESLRKEVNQKGIKVTLIEPGATGTDMQPVATTEQREKEQKLEMLKAEDIASAIIYALEQPMRCDVVDIKIRPHLQLI